MRPITTGAVCVYHEMIDRGRALNGTNIPIAAVSTGFRRAFPACSCASKEIEMSVAAGAAEIDIVISRRHVLSGNWQALYDEMKADARGLRRAPCEGDPCHRRTGQPAQRRARQLVCMMAGARISSRPRRARKV